MSPLTQQHPVNNVSILSDFLYHDVLSDTVVHLDINPMGFNAAIYRTQVANATLTQHVLSWRPTLRHKL